MPGVPPLVDQVEQFLRRQGIVHGGGVVAVSGGPDSVALLRALVALRPALLEGPLVVAHLNHQLRGGDSDADERFVRELHAALRAAGVADLGLRCDRADVAAQARKERGNLEGVARRLRYDWLAGVAREAGASWVATGHTADDQAETVLHRLLRGTGLKGLRGIAPRRRLTPGVEVVRPLLGVTRAEVLAYLEAENQPYRQDRSNLDLGYTRNRIRHELLPHLAARYNPAVVPILCRLAEQAAEAYRAAETRAADLLAEAELPRAGARLVFRADRLAAAPRHQVREMFRLVWVREGWPTGRLGFDGWDRLAALAFGEAVAVDLPGGVRAQRHGRVVQVKRTS